MGSMPEEIEEALRLTASQEYWKVCIKSEAPQHKVILTQPIYLGVHEVTQAEYEKVMGSNLSSFARTGTDQRWVEKVAGLDTASHPVEGVSWNDAAEFCAKLSDQEKLPPFYSRSGETVTMLEGIGYRLPTEAEWEFACRAGTIKHWAGDSDEALARTAWFNANAGERTHKVGQLSANPFGLFDIQGNVWEWVQDGWEPAFYERFQEKPAINPIYKPATTSWRVFRGGVWTHSASCCRASFRHAHEPSHRANSIGFRVALPVDAVRAFNAAR
jgi:formylglycine-generating enzyme required for sulfatase activity